MATKLYLFKSYIHLHPLQNSATKSKKTPQSMANGRDQEEEEEEIVVMFPFMGQGHIIPYLALALQIEQRFGYKIIFINTPLNIKKLQSSLPPSSTISLTELPFCSSDHGLPPDSENFDSLPYPLISKLFHASLSLKPSFNQLILDLTEQHGHLPLCIISDMFLGWTTDIARKLNIYHCLFNTCGAYGAAVYYSMWMNLPHCKTNSDEFGLVEFHEVGFIHRSQLPNNLMFADGSDSWSRFLQKVLPLWFMSDAILLNTIEELEQIGLEFFRRKGGGTRPIWAILPSFGNRSSIRPKKKSGVDSEKCIEWLNDHPRNSVVYVSFGSMNTISTSQMMELAMGLEASGKNFIWVVRPPTEFDLNQEFKSEWLPEGFEERVQQHNKGLIVHNWAPQLDILSHKSTCVFLSHCGWNSVLESLSHGVPILGWPLSGEQMYNSKFLEEEVGVNFEVGRGTSCEVKHENVAKAIELVMGESEKGVEMRKKACEVKKMIEDAIRDDGEGLKGSSVRAMEGFIGAALLRRKGVT